jgi:dTDP-4-amino-4,6-dideoxygalactose transaminase
MSTVGPELERRIANAERLMTRLDGIVHLQRNDAPEVTSNYMLVSAVVPRMEELSRRLLSLGIDTKHHYMRDCTGIGNDEGSYPMAARAEREVLHLPAYPELSDSQVDRVADRVRRAVTELGIAAQATMGSAAS